MIKNSIDKHRNFVYRILRRIEKFTKTDMVYLAKGSFWLNFEQGVSTVAGFALSIAFANLISPEVYGTYSYVVAIASALTVTTLNGINSSVNRAVARGEEGILMPAIKTKMRWGVLGSVISIGFAVYYYLAGNINLTFLFLIPAFFLPFRRPLGLYSNFLQGRKEFGFSVRINSVAHIISTLVLIITLLLTNNIYLILLFYFLPGLILNLIYLFWVIKKFKPNQVDSPDAISYGKYLSFIKIIADFINDFERIILWHFLGPVSIAVYSFALVPVEKIKGFVGAMKDLAFPKFSQQDDEAIKKTLLKKIGKLFLLIVPVIVVYIVFIPYVFKLVYPNYMESVLYSQLFAITLLFIPQKFLSVYFMAQKKKKAITVLNSFIPIIRLASLFALVPFFGIFGIVWSRLIIGGLNMAMFLYFFKKY